jgi:hypothetical protein
MPTPSELGGLREELLALYQRWRELTLAEGEAIRAWDWPAVEQAQSAKQELQQTIATATESLRAECTRHGVNAGKLTQEFQGVVAQLLDQEAGNSNALAAARQQAQTGLRQLDSAHRNLRQLQKAYVAEPEAGWQSYT